MKLNDLTGKTFDRLEVIRRIKRCERKHPNLGWECKCSCGQTVYTSGWDLQHGRAKSCSCLMVEKRKTGNNTKHNLHGTQEYDLWRAAKRRAKKKTIKFQLKPTDIPAIPTRCPILGIAIFRNSKRGPSSNSPSLDRIVPNKGYVLGNIQVISVKANQIKSDATIEEVGKVYNYMRNQNK